MTFILIAEYLLQDFMEMASENDFYTNKYIFRL